MHIYCRFLINLKMQCNLLNKLTNERDNWKIKVRINIKNNNELVSLDMLIIDEEVPFLLFSNIFHSYIC